MNDGEQDIGIQSKVSLLDQHSELKKKAEGIYWLVKEQHIYLVHVSYKIVMQTICRNHILEKSTQEVKHWILSIH